MTLEEMVEQVYAGAKRVDGDVEVNGRQYEAKCYWAGMVIRVDLNPQENPVWPKK